MCCVSCGTVADPVSDSVSQRPVAMARIPRQCSEQVPLPLLSGDQVAVGVVDVVEHQQRFGAGVAVPVPVEAKVLAARRHELGHQRVGKPSSVDDGIAMLSREVLEELKRDPHTFRHGSLEKHKTSS